MQAVLVARRSRAVSCATLGLAWAASVGAQQVATAPNLRLELTVAGETPAETSLQIIDAEAPGPTVLVVGGMHGDEAAGAEAARQIAGWTIRRGRLLVLARANERALRAGTRLTPGRDADRSNFNRQFPPAVDDPEADHARAVWQLLDDFEPDLLIDLHEGFDFSRINPESVGSSVIAPAQSETIARAGTWIEPLNATIAREDRKFRVLRGAVGGSLARAAWDERRIPASIFETTSKSQSLGYRVRQHRILVHAALRSLEMDVHGQGVMVGAEADEGETLVAMYVSNGVGGAGPARLTTILDEAHGFELRQVCATDIRDGRLEEFDAVIFPGGSASAQTKEIRQAGRDRVRSFVDQGGGYLGFCAGAYLAADNDDWSLHILDADVIDRDHWARGVGTVPPEWTTLGRKNLSTRPGEHGVRYANGPIYAPSENPKIPDYRVLAWYRGEVSKKGVPSGVMPDTPAVVSGRYGAGRVVCSSPHPEQTTGMEEQVRRMVRLDVQGDR